jgi:hypothetical protein
MLRQSITFACAFVIAFAASHARAVVVINEIDPGQAGFDPFEFVELYGPANTLLDGHVLVFINGANDLSYQAFDLDGWQTGPTGHFLLGTSVVFPTPDIIFLPITLHNGADAVALYSGDAADFPSGTPAASTNLLDAIVYGSGHPLDTGLLAALGETIQYSDTDTTSISRVPDGTGDFTNDTSPSPMNSGIPRIVPEPTSLTLIAALIAVSLSRRKQRPLAVRSRACRGAV